MNFTFDFILKYFNDRLKSVYNWSVSVISEDIYANMLQVIAYGIEQLALYDEILTRESVFRTAEKRNSVSAFAWTLLYTPSRVTGAKTTLTISGDETFTDYDAPKSVLYEDQTIFLPRWSVITSEDGVNVYLTEDANYNNGSITKHFNLPVVNIGDFASNLTGNSIQIVNIFGLARVPVTLVSEPLNNFNNASLGSHGIEPGSLVSIRNSALFSGDYIVQQALGGSSNAQEKDYVIYIQTPYVGEQALSVSETIALNTVLSTGHIKVEAKEGTPQEFVYKASGVINEKIPIFAPNIDNDELQAFRINDNNDIIDEITIVNDELFLIDDLSKYYAQIYNDPSYQYIYLQFGDDFRTKRLPVGQKVLIKYALTDGLDGNNNSVNFLTTFQSPPLSITGIPVEGLFVTNEVPLLEGKNLESIDSIKTNARKNFQDKNLAISSDGWLAILRTNPNVSKSIQWTETDYNPFNITPRQNIVYVSGIDSFGRIILPTSNIAQDVAFNFLRRRASVTDYISWQSSFIINTRITLRVKLKPTNVNEFKKKVREEILAKWSILNTEYKTEIYESEVIRIVKSKPEVEYCFASIENAEYSRNNTDLRPENPFFFKPTYKGMEVTLRDNYINNLGNSLKFWIRRKLDGETSPWFLIATQNPNNNLIEQLPTNSALYRGFITGGSASIGADSNNPFYNDTGVFRMPQLNPNSLLSEVYEAPLPSSPDKFLNTPFSSEDILNPTLLDPRGYEFRYTYKTVNADVNSKDYLFGNDIRLPYFNLITDILEDDIIFEIE